MQAPKADPGPIFKHALGSEIAAGHAQIRAEHLGQSPLGNTIPGGIGKLRAFLEIDYEIHRNAGVPGPLGVGRFGAVADEIAGHFASVCGSCPGEIGYQSCWQISSSE